MLPEPIHSLILEEYARHGDRFIDAADVPGYVAKLGERSEILSDIAGGRCRGFVAFYCNDESSRQAYITLVLVDPRDRGAGLGRALVGGVLEIARRRGYTSCRLEVARHNAGARAMYDAIGFRLVEDRGSKDVLEIAL